MCISFVLMVLLVNICSSQSDFNGNNMGYEVQGALNVEIFVMELLSVEFWLMRLLLLHKWMATVNRKPISCLNN